jgi:hypothetical protein
LAIVQVLLFKPPDWPALARAAAIYEATNTASAKAQLEAELLAFVERADLLTIFVENVYLPRLS